MMSVLGRLETMKTAMAHPEAQLELRLGGGQQCAQPRRRESTSTLARQSAARMGRFNWYRSFWLMNCEGEEGVEGDGEEGGREESGEGRRERKWDS